MYKKYKRKDGKKSDPKQQKRGKSNKARGAAFERRIVKLYRKYGWLVQHNTKGIYDMVCIPPVNPTLMEPYPEMREYRVHLLQPTIAKYPDTEKKMNLLMNDSKWLGSAYLVQREDKYPFKLIYTRTCDLKIRPNKHKYKITNVDFTTNTLKDYKFNVKDDQ